MELTEPILQIDPSCDPNASPRKVRGHA